MCHAQQAENQINNYKQIAKKLASLEKMIIEVLSNDDEVVKQNWNNLGDDYPELVQAVDDQTPPTQDDPVLLGGVEQTFSPRHVKKFEDALVVLKSILTDGVDVTVSTKLGRDIQQLTDGLV